MAQFYESTVLPELAAADADAAGLAVLTADAMRYLHTFRQQLAKDTLLRALPHLARHLASRAPVVATYAAHTLERLLTLRQPADPAQR